MRLLACLGLLLVSGCGFNDPWYDNQGWPPNENMQRWEREQDRKAAAERDQAREWERRRYGGSAQ